MGSKGHVQADASMVSAEADHASEECFGVTWDRLAEVIELATAQYGAGHGGVLGHLIGQVLGRSRRSRRAPHRARRWIGC